MRVRLLEPASIRIDEIYQFTADNWGEEQADAYVAGLFAAIGRLSDGGTASRSVPATLGVQGFYFKYGRHFVYWRRLEDGDIGVVSILHERMQQANRLREDFGIE